MAQDAIQNGVFVLKNALFVVENSIFVPIPQANPLWIFVKK